MRCAHDTTSDADGGAARARIAEERKRHGLAQNEHVDWLGMYVLIKSQGSASPIAKKDRDTREFSMLAFLRCHCTLAQAALKGCRLSPEHVLSVHGPVPENL